MPGNPAIIPIDGPIAVPASLNVVPLPRPRTSEEKHPLANIKSAEKRARQTIVRYARNRWYRSRYRTFVKRARHHIAEGDQDKATGAIRRAAQALDRAAQRNVIHRNKASRLKSRLMVAFNKMKVAA